MPLKFTERFKRQYLKLPPEIRDKADKALKLLDANYRHPGLRSHPVDGAPGIYEAYVDRKYRLTYEHHNDFFILRNIDNHDECLRKP
jgi:mRNA-degrading endonuclease RelE of RelBE toxin-antitoxin system